MYRYVGLVWNNKDGDAYASAQRMWLALKRSDSAWHAAVALDGMHVLAIPPVGHIFREYALPDDCGVVLGRLFPLREPDGPGPYQPTFDCNYLSEIRATDGSAISKRSWGSYVAFVRERDGARQHVIRDCSGAIPCYRLRVSNVEVFFSHITDLASLNLPRFAMNLQFIRSFIVAANLEGRDTAFDDITELLAGERATIAGNSTYNSWMWDPRTICTEIHDSDLESLAANLYETTSSSIAAWGSVHENILLNLSGGFDSAVVLGCVRESKKHGKITCINRFNERPREDERMYARSAAKRADVPLIEHPWSAGGKIFDHDLLNAPRTPRPSLAWLGNLLDVDFLSGIVRSESACGIWTGEGGDHLFFEPPTDLGAADYVHCRGINSGLLRVIKESAQLSQKPYWEVGRTALTLGLTRKNWQSYVDQARTIQLVNDEGAPERILERTKHPWNVDCEALPKGKQLQIQLISQLLNRNRPIPNFEYADYHHPLLSQPLIELCLRIPTYRLLAGGRRRGLARFAFRNIVPEIILGREQKGETTYHWTERFRQSIPFLRELLLDGHLVKERIIDRSAIQPFLMGQMVMKVEHFYPLFACVAAEIWMHTWRSLSDRTRSTLEVEGRVASSTIGVR